MRELGAVLSPLHGTEKQKQFKSERIYHRSTVHLNQEQPVKQRIQQDKRRERERKAQGPETGITEDNDPEYSMWTIHSAPESERAKASDKAIFLMS